MIKVRIRLVGYDAEPLDSLLPAVPQKGAIVVMALDGQSAKTVVVEVMFSPGHDYVNLLCKVA